MKSEVNWEDPALKRWFGTIARKSTAYNYRTAFKSYAQFTGMTATELIREADEDMKRDPLKRQDIVLQKLTKFFEWLTTEAPISSRGNTEHVVVGKGIAPRSAIMRVNAIRSFYGTFHITVKMNRRSKLRKGKVKNERLIVSAEQVRDLVQHARTIRDRAIILVNFQGGLDVSTICSLNYEDVAKAVENGEHPFKLKLYRKKADVEYYTFLGHDAIDALKAYVADQKARGVEWTPESPLFTKERHGTDERLTPNLIQNMMKEVVVSAGLVDHENNGKDFNILGTHALRESFSSIMLNSGIPKPIVDFWLGHTRGDMDNAYMKVQEAKASEMYLKREHLISINASTEDTEKLRKIEGSVSDLMVEKEELKEQIAKLYDYVHKNFDPLLDLVNEIATTEDGRKQIQQAQQRRRDEQHEKDRAA
jgi:integrase